MKQERSLEATVSVEIESVSRYKLQNDLLLEGCKERIKKGQVGDFVKCERTREGMFVTLQFQEGTVRIPFPWVTPLQG